MDPRRIVFLSGMPRAGSTLLACILAQNPRFHVTPTSGIVDMLSLIRDGVFDGTVTQSPEWASIEGVARFWEEC